MLCKEKKRSQGIVGGEGEYAVMNNIQGRSLYFLNYESMITHVWETWKI